MSRYQSKFDDLMMWFFPIMVAFVVVSLFVVMIVEIEEGQQNTEDCKLLDQQGYKTTSETGNMFLKDMCYVYNQYGLKMNYDVLKSGKSFNQEIELMRK